MRRGRIGSMSLVGMLKRFLAIPFDGEVGFANTATEQSREVRLTLCGQLMRSLGRNGYVEGS